MSFKTILRNLVFLSVAVTSCLFLTSHGASAGGAEFVIKLATVAPDGTPWANHLKDIKKHVEKESNGRIKMKLFMGGTLGGEVETVRDLRRGRLQGWGGTTAAIAEGASIPELQLMELPFLFESFEEAEHILDNVVQNDFIRIMEKKGFAFSQWHENGWRNFAVKKKPIHTIEDLQSIKMRSQESPVHLAMYKALGVQAESIPVPEVLGALQTGMVDGFDNTPLFSAATGWYEGIKYYTISQHIYQPGMVIYSKKFMDKMPEDLRKLVLGDARKEAAKGRKLVRAMRADILKNFREAGITIYEMTPAERQAFIKRTRSVHSEFENIVGKSLLKKVYAAQQSFRKKK
ncbi:MAG: TRAP transporter substrate-binding protein [Proteobacteria bacterium]|nr:TRAP transporter substrate-binding protein [Pseudomonadota bacterium]